MDSLNRVLVATSVSSGVIEWVAHEITRKNPKIES